NFISESKTIYMTFQVNRGHSAEANYGLNYFPFDLPDTAAIDFVNQLLMDANTIKLYEEAKYWPKRGNNCVRYGRVCEYYGVCDSYQTEKTIADLAQAAAEFEQMAIEDV